MNSRHDALKCLQEEQEAAGRAWGSLLEVYLAHRLPGRDVQSVTIEEITEMLGYLTTMLEREAKALAAGGTYDPLMRYPLHRT